MMFCSVARTKQSRIDLHVLQGLVTTSARQPRPNTVQGDEEGVAHAAEETRPSS